MINTDGFTNKNEMTSEDFKQVIQKNPDLLVFTKSDLNKFAEDLRDNIEKSEDAESFEDILKAELSDLHKVVIVNTDFSKSEVWIKKSETLDIEKGKRGTLGEIREWKGQKVQKTATGWVPVKGSGKPSKEEKPAEKKSLVEYSHEELKSKLDQAHQDFEDGKITEVDFDKKVTSLQNAIKSKKAGEKEVKNTEKKSSKPGDPKYPGGVSMYHPDAKVVQPPYYSIESKDLEGHSDWEGRSGKDAFVKDSKTGNLDSNMVTKTYGQSSKESPIHHASISRRASWDDNSDTEKGEPHFRVDVELQHRDRPLEKRIKASGSDFYEKRDELENTKFKSFKEAHKAVEDFVEKYNKDIKSYKGPIRNTDKSLSKSEEDFLSQFFSGDEIEDSPLEKSLVDDLSYSNNLTVDKKGKEVKEKLADLLEQIEDESSQTYSQLQAKLLACGEEPEKDTCNYQVETYKKILPDLPKVYSWEDIYPKIANKIYDSSENSLSVEEKTEVETPTAEMYQARRDYNQLVDKYIYQLIDGAQIDTMMRSFKDDQVYKLSIKQATILGF